MLGLIFVPAILGRQDPGAMRRQAVLPLLPVTRRLPFFLPYPRGEKEVLFLFWHRHFPPTRIGNTGAFIFLDERGVEPTITKEIDVCLENINEILV